MTKGKITASDMRAALKNAHPEQEYVTLFEVSEGTGAYSGRRADAVVLNLWPSRGFEITGFEIKVSRSDWLSELKQPAKADAFFPYCDRWALFAPQGVAKKEELPTGWGLWELTPSGRIRRTVQPPKNENVLEVPRHLLMALMRGRGRLDKNELLALERKAYIAGRDSVLKNQPKDYGVGINERRLAEGLATMAEIKEATGIDLLSFKPAAAWIAKIKLANSSKLSYALQSVANLLGDEELKARVATALDIKDPATTKKGKGPWG